LFNRIIAMNFILFFAGCYSRCVFYVDIQDILHFYHFVPIQDEFLNTYLFAFSSSSNTPCLLT